MGWPARLPCRAVSQRTLDTVNAGYTPFCAQAMAESVGPPFNKFGADAAEADDEELLDEELLDEEELVDDDGLLRGTEGRPSSRRAK